MAMELFEKGTYMYSLMADYWVLNRNPKFILEVSALSIKKFHMIKSKPEILLLLKQVKIQW